MFKKILAVGDCNTLGAGGLEGNSYPELFARRIGAEVCNLGHTMATTREGVLILEKNLTGADCVLIQFGLVDSYKTFKYAPYVLYYPDNFFRKQFRSVTKSFKKYCRKLGLNAIMGEINVVSAAEYEKNIRKMIAMAGARTVILLDTVPYKERERNREIVRYNNILSSICDEFENCIKIHLYDIFLSNIENYYSDQTHCNESGYSHIADILSREVGLHLQRYHQNMGV